MNEDIETKALISRRDKFLGEREEILSIAPEKALDRILSHPYPDDLVQSFSEEDFHFLIHDIGLEDALSLLSMASETQWEYILDIESWDRDRVNIAAVTKWFNRLLQANPNRLIKWLLEDQPEFFEFYLFKNIEVIVREHDQDPSVLGEGFFTFDDVYYMRIIDEPFGRNSESQKENLSASVLPKLLERLADFDHIRFQQVMLETQRVIPAEIEEEAYRLKNIRLEEKGFLSFDQAVGIYQHLIPEKLHPLDTKIVTGENGKTIDMPLSLYPLKMITGADLFTSALKSIEGYDILQQLQTEFAGLCNQIITADQKIIRDREQLRHVVKKACGYLSIGLRRLVGPMSTSSNKQGKDSAANLLRFPLSQIFRVGYGSALELKWRVEKWNKKSWFGENGLPLNFWGETWLGVMGGLLIKKPLYYDNYRTGQLYREFASYEDIAETEKVLNEIIAFDSLLSKMGIKIKPVSATSILTYKSLVLTLWARHYLNYSGELLPLPIDGFRKFYKQLWGKKTIPRKIHPAAKTSFLEWVAGKAGLTPHEAALHSGKTFEALFNEIESEYGYVASKDLDPRYIHLFLIDIIL